MKLGLTCEGGAYRSIFTSAVLDVFLEESIIADYLIGVSAGIAYGISYPSRQKERNLKILQTYAADRRYLSYLNLLKPGNRSIYGLQFAFYDVPNKHILLDYDALEAFEGEIVAVATNVETGKAEYLPVARDTSMLDLLLASCAMPIVFPIVEYQGKKYMDGGVADAIPFERAIEDGCDRNIVILTRERDYHKGREKGVELAAKLYRKYPKFSEALKRRSDVYNQKREKLFALEKKGDLIVICPEDTKGFSRSEKDAKKLQAMYDQGIKVSKENMPQIKAYLAK